MQLDLRDASHSTSVSLLVRVKARDPEAWQRLVALYGPLVLRWARTYLPTQADAEDVVQEVFRSVFLGIDRFRKERPTDRFRSWLWSIMRRRVVDHYRRNEGEIRAAGGDDATAALLNVRDVPLDDPEEEASFVSEVILRALELVRAEFEERTWQACWRTTVDGESAADVGAALGMSTGAVYIARSRVLKRLKGELEGLI